MKRHLLAAGLVGLAVLAGTTGAGAARQDAAGELAPLLKKAADYCRRLESSVLDFVCREEIKEIYNPALDVPGPISVQIIPGADSWTSSGTGIRTAYSRAVAKVKRSYIYDYQCVRKDGRIREARTLLAENGKKKNEPNAALKTSVILFEDVLLGPAGMFRESSQAGFDFRIVGPARFDKKPVVLIEAKPRPGASRDGGFYGQAWLDPDTGDILKIEYAEDRIERYEVFAARGRKYGRTPRIRMRTEFSSEKNGLRFPNRFSVEETYVNDAGRVFVRSETTVAYTGFKFFTVETVRVDVR